MARPRVLFIGNSFTARHDVPALVALVTGWPLEHRLISAGGASLRRHWNAGEAARAIAAGGWDAVVLQEQSTLPVRDPGRMRGNVRLFLPMIDASGARAVLFATWARRDALADQASIDRAYAAAAAGTSAAIAPVGAAWARVLRLRRPPLLHDRDGSHATLAGAYLAACVIAAAAFGVDPAAAAAPVGIAAADADRLRRAACAVVGARAVRRRR